jgi:hypothetical protein
VPSPREAAASASDRDFTAYVQLDFTYQAFLTAALILFGMEGTKDVRRSYKGAPYDAANPGAAATVAKTRETPIM